MLDMSTPPSPVTIASADQSESELDTMLRLLPRYAEHVTRTKGSLISRFYGIYRISNPTTKR